MRRLLCRWLALGLSLSAPVVLAQPSLNTISRVEVKAGVVEITGTQKPSFSTFPMSDPPRLVVDISEAVFSGVPEVMDVASGHVVAIRTASYGNDASAIARVVIGFDREVEPDIQSVGNKLVVRSTQAPGSAPAVAAVAPSARSAATPPGSGGSPVAVAALTSTPSTPPPRGDVVQLQAPAPAAAADKQRQDAAAAAAAAAEQQRQQAAAAAAAEQQRQQAAAAAAEQQRQQAAAAAAAAAAADKQRQEAALAAAAAAAEKQRLDEAAAAQAAAEQRRREDAAAAAAAEEKRRQADAAAAAAEEARLKQEAAAARTLQDQQQAAAQAAAAEAQRKKDAAAVAAAAERERQQKAAAAAAAEEAQRREAAAAAAAAEERHQAELAQQAQAQRQKELLAAAAAPTPAPTPVSAASVSPASGGERTSGGAEVNSKTKALTFVGFDGTGPRVYVRTSGPVRYTISSEEKNTVVLQLDNTSIPLRNNARALDTAFFAGPVLRIQPERGPKNSVRVAITLRDAVAYQAHQDGNEVSVQFRAP
ncbi:MAG: AMIN domain-containing protein [Myxococcaceae bacterium]